MKKNLSYTLLLLSLCLSALPLRAQVSVETALDSAQIWIGQQVGLTVRVSADANAQVSWPSIDSLQQLTEGVEVVGIEPVDTEWINDGARMTLSRKYVITSFDSALYYLPPFQLSVDGKPYEAAGHALKVYTVDIDTLHPDSIFGLNEVMAPDFSWDDYRSLIVMSVLLILLAALLAYVIVRLKQNKPIVRRIRTKKALPAHKVAMEKLGRIKAEQMELKEDSKAYYTALTDTLREYMQSRYGFNALEMTTNEIVAKLSEVNDAEAVKELRELFETADLVKFAKHSTLLNENDRNLLNAIEYVNSTKPAEEEKKQPEEITVVDKRSQTTKRLLIAGVAVTSLVLLYLLFCIGYRVWVLVG